MLLAITVILSCCVISTDSWRRRRGGGGPPPCGPRNCVVGSWNAWSACNHLCWTSGTQRRARPQVSPASCGGSCPYTFNDNRAGNRDNCRIGERPIAEGALVDRVTRGHVVKEVRKNTCGAFKDHCNWLLL